MIVYPSLRSVGDYTLSLKAESKGVSVGVPSKIGCHLLGGMEQMYLLIFMNIPVEHIRRVLLLDFCFYVIHLCSFFRVCVELLWSCFLGPRNMDVSAAADVACGNEQASDCHSFSNNHGCQEQRKQNWISWTEISVGKCFYRQVCWHIFRITSALYFVPLLIYELTASTVQSAVTANSGEFV